MLKNTLLSIMALIILTSCSDNSHEKTANNVPPLPVEVITVKHQNIPLWIRYTGKTEASSSQEVRARVTGVLEAVYYKDGEYVKKGQKI